MTPEESHRPTEREHLRSVVVEEATLLVSIIKWAALASVVGAMAGGSTRGFVWALESATGTIARLPHFYWLLPVAIPFAAWLVDKLAPEAAQRGAEPVIRALHESGGKLQARIAPVKFVTTVITAACGGSVGKVGPSAQIGAALASGTAHLLRLEDIDRRRLVVCGISGGFAAVFGAPLAGALFGIEVLYLGRLEYQVLFPCLVSGMVAHLVCGEVHPVSPAIVGGTELSHGALVALGLGAGLLFGLIAVVLMEVQHLVVHVAERFRKRPLLLGAAGGVVVAALLSVAGTDYAGLGVDTIDRALSGAHIFALAFLFKILATTVTLETGGSGGIITPMFFIGATAGNVMGRLFGVSSSLTAAMGMFAVLSAGANTPIAASVMALETLGVAFGTYAAVGCAAAFLIAGHRSVYPSQVLGLAKTPSLELPEDMELGKVEVVHVRVRPHTVLALLVRLFRRRRAEDESAAETQDED